jgi:glycosyltransferase involved in cell wall biosynthesis
MRVGVFHWNFSVKGGGEEVAYDIARALGLRKVYTIYSQGFAEDIETIDVAEYLPRWAKLLGKIVRNVRTLEYWFWEMVDITELGDFDVVITSGATVRSIITPEDVMHVHYLHSVPRWLYDLWHYRWKLVGRRMLTFAAAQVFRLMDKIVDSRVDYYFTNSELIKRRLWKYYKRDAVVLYPPIRVNEYRFKEYGDFILHMGRFDKEKQIMPVVKACEKAGVKLILIGTEGNDRETLEYVKKHNGNIEYLGYVSKKEKLDLLARCKAVIYNPVSEDFGIVPVEALASGKPVIVNDTGYPPLLIKRTGYIENDGVLKIYKGGIITKGDVNTIARAIKILDRYEWSPEEIKGFAQPFDFSVFQTRLKMQLKIWKQKFDKMLEVKNNAI